MKYLQILNWTALLAGACMTVVVAVVWLMLWSHQAQAESLGSRLAPVAAATAVFGGFAAVAGLTVWSQRRRLAWRWWAQAALVAAAAGLVPFIRALP